MFNTPYFDMYREGLFRVSHTDAKYTPKRSTKIKNKIRNARRKKGKKK